MSPRTDPLGAQLFLPVLLLAATLAGARLVMRGPDRLFGWALAALFGTGLLWVIVSALFPAKAERGCPSCGAEALERSDPERTVGVRCPRCGFLDETASSFLLAEDDGVPLEPLLLQERAERAARRERAAVDREASAD